MIPVKKSIDEIVPIVRDAISIVSSVESFEVFFQSPLGSLSKVLIPQTVSVDDFAPRNWLFCAMGPKEVKVLQKKPKSLSLNHLFAELLKCFTNNNQISFSGNAVPLLSWELKTIKKEGNSIKEKHGYKAMAVVRMDDGRLIRADLEQFYYLLKFRLEKVRLIQEFIPTKTQSVFFAGEELLGVFLKGEKRVKCFRRSLEFYSEKDNYDSRFFEFDPFKQKEGNDEDDLATHNKKRLENGPHVTRVIHRVLRQSRNPQKASNVSFVFIPESKVQAEIEQLTKELVFYLNSSLPIETQTAICKFRRHLSGSLYFMGFSHIQVSEKNHISDPILLQKFNEARTSKQPIRLKELLFLHQSSMGFIQKKVTLKSPSPQEGQLSQRTKQTMRRVSCYGEFCSFIFDGLQHTYDPVSRPLEFQIIEKQRKKAKVASMKLVAPGLLPDLLLSFHSIQQVSRNYERAFEIMQKHKILPVDLGKRLLESEGVAITKQKEKESQSSKETSNLNERNERNEVEWALKEREWIQKELKAVVKGRAMMMGKSIYDMVKVCQNCYGIYSFLNREIRKMEQKERGKEWNEKSKEKTKEMNKMDQFEKVANAASPHFQHMSELFSCQVERKKKLSFVKRGPRAKSVSLEKRKAAPFKSPTADSPNEKSLFKSFNDQNSSINSKTRPNSKNRSGFLEENKDTQCEMGIQLGPETTLDQASHITQNHKRALTQSFATTCPVSGSFESNWRTQAKKSVHLSFCVSQAEDILKTLSLSVTPASRNCNHSGNKVPLISKYISSVPRKYSGNIIGKNSSASKWPQEQDKEPTHFDLVKKMVMEKEKWREIKDKSVPEKLKLFYKLTFQKGVLVKASFPQMLFHSNHSCSCSSFKFSFTSGPHSIFAFVFI